MKSTVLLLLLIGLVGAGNACSIHSIEAALAGQPFLPQSPNAYTTKEVVEAMEGLGATTEVYVSPKTTTFACVDARGAGIAGGLSAVPTLETPGGDFAELAALMIAYHRIKNTTISEASVVKIFRAFMGKVVNKKRPFYLHTADAQLQIALKKYKNLTGEEVVVVPNVEPKNQTVSDAWYTSLALPEAQGCGHIRYMMQKPASYDLNTPAEAAVPAHLMKAFFKYWWPTKEGSVQRAKVVYPILQGSLGGGALVIVSNVGPDCLDKELDPAPFHGGSSMFLYHGNAVSALRKSVLIPFIKGYDRKVNTTDVLSAMNELQGRQLATTLQLLSPLNTLPIYTVDVTTYSEESSDS